MFGRRSAFQGFVVGHRSGRSRLLRAVGLAGLAVLTLGAAACHRGGGDPDARAQWVSERVADKLDLDEAQKAKLAVVRTRIVDALKELRTARDATRALVREETAKERMDAQRLTSSLQANVEVVSRRLPGVVDAVVDFHATLDAEQQGEVKDLVDRKLSHGDKRE